MSAVRMVPPHGPRSHNACPVDRLQHSHDVRSVCRAAAFLSAAGLAQAGAVAIILCATTDTSAQTDRSALIVRAQVWSPTNIPSMDLKAGPRGPGSFAPGQTVQCDYLEKDF